MENPDRRAFLRQVFAATAATAAVPVASLAAGAQRPGAIEGDGPYGPLEDRDGIGVLVPAGFSVRAVAVSGTEVPGTGYRWRPDPDGAGTFSDGAGGWFHAVNHETEAGAGGGVSVLHFDSNAIVVDAYSVLTGTNRNCAGGPTPWGSWLSCEEVAGGRVFECDPARPGEGEVRPALGVFNHEAVAVDPDRGQLFLTEDRDDGLLYRFTPESYPDLSAGVLAAARVVDGVVEWVEVPDPSATSGETRHQLGDGATRFDGGEGIWYHRGRVYFTTKGDHRVWDLDVVTGSLSVVWSGSPGDPARDQLTGVDNITVETGTGDLFVAEDGGNMELVQITAEGTVAPFLRVTGQGGSEITGPVFSPDGRFLMFSSQRGVGGDGITYVVSGPFRGATPSYAEAAIGQADTARNDDDDGRDDSERGAGPEPTDGAYAETALGQVETDEEPGSAPAPTVGEDSEPDPGPTEDPELEPAPSPAPTETLQQAESAALGPGIAQDDRVDRDSAPPVAAIAATAVAGVAGAALIALRRRTEREAEQLGP